MGTVQFVISESRQRAIPAEDWDAVLACGYLAGEDDVPWPTRLQLSSGRLRATRASSESARLVIPWPVAQIGRLALTTTSLPAGAGQYRLTLELARGTLARIAVRINELAAGRVDVPAGWTERWEALLDQMAEAVVLQSDVERCDELAQEVIDRAQPLGSELAKQRVAILANRSMRHATQLGVRVDRPEEIRAARRASDRKITAFHIAPRWDQIQPEADQWDWSSVDQLIGRARGRNRTAVLGPVVPLDRHALPDWLYLWTGDLDAIVSFVVAYVEATVRRFRGATRLWICGGEFPVGRELGLSEEESLQVAVAATEAVMRLDPDTPRVAFFAQPFGEALGHCEWDLAPWQVADMLMRSDLGLAGLFLQFDFFVAPERSLPRELLEMSRGLDRWLAWNRPLLVGLKARTSTSEGVLRCCLPPIYLEHLCRLLADTNAVQALFWEQWGDTADDPAGLVDRSGDPKPVLDAFLRTRAPSLGDK